MSDDTSFPVSDQSNFIHQAASIVSAYVSNNRVPPAELPALLSGTYAAVAGLGKASVPVDAGADKPTPAQIRKSIRHEGLVSFIDQKQYKTLKRHLTKHGLDPINYRERYGLPKDYPMTAESYSEQRSVLAKSAGLGQPYRNIAPKVAEVTSQAGKQRGRKKAGAAK